MIETDTCCIATVLQLSGKPLKTFVEPQLSEITIDPQGRVIKNRFGPTYTPTIKGVLRDIRKLVKRH